MVADSIKKIIKERRLLQKEVAEDAGYTYKVLNYILNAKAPMRENDIVKLCEALKVSPNEYSDGMTSKRKTKWTS